MIRIIGGSHKGRKISAPKNLPVRPTTDFAKEALFNILRNKFDFEEITALDLFCGTGNISYELASRGTKDITCVDIDSGCIHFVKQTAKQFEFDAIHASNYDVFKFLKKQTRQWDFIFADPPFTHQQTTEIPGIIFEHNLLKEDGWLIVEHPPRTVFPPGLPLVDIRTYGKVNFAIFGKK
jgi:16S rRNA (guanine(966)-N(2))-methyltransferase RsmD